MALRGDTLTMPAARLARCISFRLIRLFFLAVFLVIDVTGAEGSTSDQAAPLFSSTDAIRERLLPINHRLDRAASARIRAADNDGDSPRLVVLALSLDVKPPPGERVLDLNDLPDDVPESTGNQDEDRDQVLEPNDVVEPQSPDDEDFKFDPPPDDHLPAIIRAIEAAIVASTAAQEASLSCATIAAACDAANDAANDAAWATAAADAAQLARTLPEAEYAADQAELAAAAALAASETAARIAAGDTGGFQSAYVIPLTAYAHGSGRESLPPDVEVEVRAGEGVECCLYVPADGATT